MYSQTVILGILVSILFTELTGLSPAGLIVPGYIVLALHSPGRVLYTLCIAAAAMLLCRLMGQAVILYGRRQFAVTILLAFFLSTGLHSLGFLPFRMEAIGWLIPGIIAREFDRQGIWKTVLSLATVTCLLVLILFLCGWPVAGL